MYVPVSLYKKFESCFPILTVDVAIARKDFGILLVKRITPPCVGEWFFPGGRVFKNEDFVDAARRKAFEEVGLQVEPIKIIDLFDFKEDGRHSYGPVYFCKTEDNRPVKIDSTSSHFRWGEDIDELAPNEKIREIVKMALKEYADAY